MKDETYKNLEAVVTVAEEKLDAARKAFRKYKLSICGIAVGDIVESQGKKYKVSHVDVQSWEPNQKEQWFQRPSLTGHTILKDGSFGTLTRHIYGEWKRVTP